MEWWIWLLIIGVITIPFRLIQAIHNLDKKSKLRNKNKDK